MRSSDEYFHRGLENSDYRVSRPSRHTASSSVTRNLILQLNVFLRIEYWCCSCYGRCSCGFTRILNFYRVLLYVFFPVAMCTWLSRVYVSLMLSKSNTWNGKCFLNDEIDKNNAINGRVGGNGKCVWAAQSTGRRRSSVLRTQWNRTWNVINVNILSKWIYEKIKENHSQASHTSIHFKLEQSRPLCLPMCSLFPFIHA